jgi:hypothetical protein
MMRKQYQRTDYPVLVADKAQNPLRSPGQTLFEQFFLALTQALKEHLPVDRLHLAALEVLIAVIEHPAYLCQFVKVWPYAVCGSQSMK